MRICVLTSTPDITGLDKATLLSRLDASIDSTVVTEINFVTYRLPKPGLDPLNLHYLPGAGSFRITLCRRLFRIIDGTSCIPACLALIPLWLCSREIRETLLATDPDVILFFGIRWRSHLHRYLRRHYPHWIFMTRPHQSVPSIHPLRTFDPSASVSIILPTYNGSRYLPQSVESCLGQTYKNLELIVVDDGSTEDIVGILKPYKDPRLRIFRHEKNLGLPQALNTGFRNSTGKYLTWTSDDNYYADEAIEEMSRFLQTYPEVDFVYADSYILDESDGNPAPKVQRNALPEDLSVRNGIGACFLYKRKVYETIGEYNPRFFLAEDYDYWIRVAQRFRMQRLFRPLYYYRFHRNSLTLRYSREVITEVTEMIKRVHNM